MTDLNKASALQSHIDELTAELGKVNSQLTHWLNGLNLEEAKKCADQAELIRNRIQRKQKQLTEALTEPPKKASKTTTEFVHYHVTMVPARSDIMRVIGDHATTSLAVVLDRKKATRLAFDFAETLGDKAWVVRSQACNCDDGRQALEVLLSDAFDAGLMLFFRDEDDALVNVRRRGRYEEITFYHGKGSLNGIDK